MDAKYPRGDEIWSPDGETYSPELWGETRLSKEASSDLIPVTKLDIPGKGVDPLPFLFASFSLSMSFHSLPEAYVKMADPVQINLSEG
jgi:hypothetical protein